MILDRARARTGAFGAMRLWICGLVAALAALAGCSTNTNVSNGTPVVTVNAQAAQGFSTYVVGISLYSLTRTDGYISYPAGYTAEEFADLTQRVDLTELLNAVGIPTGTYTSLVIGVDYSIPLVYLSGSATAATVENSAGTADPGIIYVTVKLDPSHPLVVGENQSTPLALDFNLAASNEVDASTNVVTVRPFVEAMTPSNDTAPVRARGLIVVANPGQNNLIEDLRPFEDNVYSTVGALTVNTSASTYYNIDGTVLIGTAGLEQLNKVASNTPIEAYGTLDGTPAGSNSTITPSFTATQVYAGTVVSNGEYEHVRGIVSAINGDTLTVVDSTYLYYEGYCQSNLCYTYYPTATITVGPSTVVTQDNVDVTASSLSPSSISVGSQIDAIGLGTTNSANALSLDATAGLVRLQSTPIWGTLDAGTASSATIDLGWVGNTNYAASVFNLAGTGSSSANDAVAASYQVNTTGANPGADQSATTAGTLVRIDGFPTPAGSAPPDFTATDVIPGTSEPADLVVEWGKGAGTTAPFTSYDTASLALNLSGADLAEVLVGPQAATLSGTPAISISGGTQFAIGNSTNGVSMFSSSTAFVSDLGTSLNGSTSVFRVVAVGSYDSATNTFTASRLEVALE
jgi:hypothetical protein